MSRKNNGNSSGLRRNSDTDDAVVVVVTAGRPETGSVELDDDDKLWDLIDPDDTIDDDSGADSDEPSKSQRKRDADDIRALGQKLAELGPSERATVPLDDDILSAIDLLNAIRKHGAKKRQLGFLAKRLRRIDLEPIEAALDRLARAARASGERHHRIERWRDRLLGKDASEAPADALTAYLDENPDADRQRLRQLQRRALDEHAKGRPPASARALFRLMRDLPASADPDAASEYSGESVDSEGDLEDGQDERGTPS